MTEEFIPQPPEENFEDTSKNEGFENLCKVFDAAEAAFESGGREAAKPYLGAIYSSLIDLNKTNSVQGNRLESWNEAGELTEDQFNELNLRRKKLSNAIGIMTSSGEIRHDLNEL